MVTHNLRENVMKRFAFIALSTVAILLPAVAQAGEVQNREVNQQERIGSGLRNGTINQTELKNLETREAALNATRVRDLRHNDGSLTTAEKVRLNQRENNISRAIYRDKHNDGVKPQ